MATRQFEHLQQKSLKRLQALIPHDCPLYVIRKVPSGFFVRTLGEADGCAGRFEVVAAWITGYVVGWKRVRHAVNSAVDAVSRTYLPPRRS